MSAKQLRSCALLMAAAVIVLLQQVAPVAQLEPERPRVSIQQMSSQQELWPADVNEDGVTDLISEIIGLRTVVQIGAGDGTFGPTFIVADGLLPAGVGDVNNDGFIDVLMLPSSSNSTGYVAAGHGDGTFSQPAPVGIALGRPTYVVDMNHDGRPDLITTNSGGAPSPRALVYPGNGDFTFGAATVLLPSTSPSSFFGIAIADLTGDGSLDVALNSTFAQRIDLFENQGDLVFVRKTILLDHYGGGLAARDLNGDGIVDLVAGMGRFDTFLWRDGFLYVLLGTGGGNFAPPVRYPVNIGPVSVVIGDFNGDGIPDVATGNQSVLERCEGEIHLSDSISILPGRGDGTFGPTRSFALSYQRAVNRLNTSDLNADGRTDLLVSRGAIVLSLPPGENGSPVADAGPDRVSSADFRPRLLGSATDPDHDWLAFEWTDDLGRTLGNLRTQCISAVTQQITREFTLTVRDGEGATSSDTMRWTFVGGGGPFPGPIPPDYSGHDIGDVQEEGAAGLADGVFRVTGSGADIWGTADAFRFVNTSVTGNFDVVTRVDSVENVDPWTKAGLMVRENLTATSRHASIFATPTAVNGVVFQRREREGAESVHTPGPLVTSPVWIRLQRSGDVIAAYTRATNSNSWELVGTQTLSGLPASVYVGMAVTSHRQGALATALFSGFIIDGASPTPPDLPPGWQSVDVGAVAVAGKAESDSVAFYLDGSGADIWGTQDEFHYAYTKMPGDGVAVVRVRTIGHTHEWAKAGLMIRQSLDPSSAHHYLLMSNGQGNAYQRRLNTGEETLHTALEPSPPGGDVWYRIERSGGTIRMAYSTLIDAPVWQPIGEAIFPTGEVLIGLAVTSHADGQLADALFDHVTITLGNDPPTALPPGWRLRDVGGVGHAGSATFDGSTFTVRASGADIWGTSDQFSFIYRTLSSDGAIAVRVATLQNTHEWAKAGVMIRASLSAGGQHAAMFVTPGNGLAYQRRLAFLGGPTTYTDGGAGAPPAWVALTRTGNVIHAFRSDDGITWTWIGGDVFEDLPTIVYVGLAVTSHDNSVAATATFDGLWTTP